MIAILGGLGAALVQQKTPPTRAELSTVFWAQLAIGCAVVGVVFVSAPFVVRLWPELPEHSDLLLRALVRGATLVDAAYYALPALSWQCVVVGDPLYRPFAVPFDEQWKKLRSLPPRLAGYAALRRAHQLDALNHRDEATALLRDAQRDVPCLALGVALANELQMKAQFSIWRRGR